MNIDTTAAAMAALETAQAAWDQVSSQNSASQPWTPELVKYLATRILGFSTLALVVSGVLLWRANASAQQVLRTIGVVSIIAFSSLLLVVGYDNQDLTPIIGLFGALAGYLLGKDTSASTK